MKKRLNAFFLLLMQFSALVHANGITVGGTRVIFNGDKKEASLNITSTDTNPYLIQSWIDPEQENNSNVPFIITPPLFRIENNEQNVLRIVYTGGKLPEDRESLYWINVKSIPAGDKNKQSNALEIAINTRIKLIYRPSNLIGTAEEIAKKLIWNQIGNKITVTNPTPFIMNFQSIRIGAYSITDSIYVMPMSQRTFIIPDGVSGVISWEIINDYGGVGQVHISDISRN